MRVAIASDGQLVSEHFGHCQGFTIYEVEDSLRVKKEFVDNPGHKPGYLPVFLKENNVDIIISGGMGSSAQNLFEQNGIEVIVGTSGLCDDVIGLYIDGSIKSTGSVCNEHMHEKEC